jgi:hypothetical protein
VLRFTVLGNTQSTRFTDFTPIFRLIAGAGGLPWTTPYAYSIVGIVLKEGSGYVGLPQAMPARGHYRSDMRPGACTKRRLYDSTDSTQNESERKRAVAEALTMGDIEEVFVPVKYGDEKSVI